MMVYYKKINKALLHILFHTTKKANNKNDKVNYYYNPNQVMQKIFNLANKVSKEEHIPLKDNTAFRLGLSTFQIRTKDEWIHLILKKDEEENNISDNTQKFINMIKQKKGKWLIEYNDELHSLSGPYSYFVHALILLLIGSNVAINNMPDNLK